MTSLINSAISCSECRVCEGAAFQTPPVMFAGNPKAPILALGQNPGQIKSEDEERQVWMETFSQADPGILGPGMPLWYFWDFIGSHGHRQLAKVFGKNWFTDGAFVWSNAVRCRTPGNNTPSNEMAGACSVWTGMMTAGRSAVIMVGTMARYQVLGDSHAALPWGIPRRHPSLGMILAIKHYSAWRANDADNYRKAVKKILEKI